MKGTSTIYCVMVFLGLVSSSLMARDHWLRAPRNDRSFYDLITKYQFAVVLFYQENKEINKDRHMRQINNFMDGTFARLSRNGYYRDGDLAFIKVNVMRDDLENVQHEYQITTLPSILIFRNGVPFQDAQGKRLMIAGQASADQIDSLIAAHLKKELDANVQKRAEQRRIQRELDAWYGYGPNVYWNWGWGWPGYCGAWGWPNYYGGCW